MSQLKPLTLEEKDIILPILIKLLKLKTSPESPIVSDKIIKFMNDKKETIGFKCNFSNQRLMKLINYIRSFGLLPIISGSNGYYVSDRKDEIVSMIESLESRIDSIRAAQQGLKNILVELTEANKLREFERDVFGIDWPK